MCQAPSGPVYPDCPSPSHHPQGTSPNLWARWNSPGAGSQHPVYVPPQPSAPACLLSLSGAPLLCTHSGEGLSLPATPCAHQLAEPLAQGGLQKLFVERYWAQARAWIQQRGLIVQQLLGPSAMTLCCLHPSETAAQPGVK